MKSSKSGLCPHCGKRVGSKSQWFPFCSERCRMVDLGKWLEGRFRIPGRRVSQEELPDSEEVN